MPETLNFLQGNPSRFRRFVSYVSRVLPQVHWVSVRPHNTNSNTLVLTVWSHPQENERDDLAIPLRESGTGVSQVLAMLYVVVTADEPKTILIDEPNSFLHPGAVRALLEIFKEHSQHQYILTTHSPAVITEAEPRMVYILETEANEARLRSIDMSQVEHQRDVLDAVGARLADVFGPTRILWVEGRTEERAFPLIVRGMLNRPLLDVRIVGVVNTGDFEGKLARTTLEVYRRLCEGVALVPPACGFLFDREGRSEESCTNLTQACGGKLEFLPRRMYENYLLDPDAIAFVLEDGLPDGPKPSAADARMWIEARRAHFEAGPVERPPDARVDGAKLLMALFKDLTNQRLTYDKVAHGTQLTQWLITNRPQALREVADLLERLLPPPS